MNAQQLSIDVDLNSNVEELSLCESVKKTSYYQSRKLPFVYLIGRYRSYMRLQITNTEDEVFNQLQALHVNKSCGPDGVPNTIIQMIATFLKEPLTKIFNKSRGEISVSLEAC